MKRYAWLLLAIIPVGLAAYMLRTSSTPAPLGAKEAPDTNLPQQLAEAISARPSPPAPASDTNIPARLADPFSTPTSGGTDAAAVNHSAPAGNTYGMNQYMSPSASGRTGHPGVIFVPRRTRANTPLSPRKAAEEEQALAAEKGRFRVDTYSWKEQAKIDASYTYEATKLLGLLEQRVQRLNTQERAKWDDFYQSAKKDWTSPGCTNDPKYEPIRGLGSPVRKSPADQYQAARNRLESSRESTQNDFKVALHWLGLVRTEKMNGLYRAVTRQRVVQRQNESRAKKEAERKLAGDETPFVETIAAVGENQFCAIIGDAMVREGSTVQGYRVQKIRVDSVEFEKDGKVWVQKVN